MNFDPEPWKKSCDDCESVESKYPCPVYNCSKHGNEAIKWTHGGGCGGGFRLYSNGKEKCQKCGIEGVFCLKIFCCYDSSKNQKQYSKIKIRNMVEKLVEMYAINVRSSFFFSIRVSIDKQYKDYPERFAD